MVAGISMLVGCLLGTVGSSHRSSPSSEPAAVAAKPDSVQVDYRFVTVELPYVAPVRKAARTPQRHVVRVTRTHTQSPPFLSQRPFLSRARQLVFGDGRARPEPFPRVERK